MVINKTLPRIMLLLVLMVVPGLAWPGGQNETPAQKKERQKQEQIKQQQEKQKQEQAKQQQEKERQQQVRQQQEQQKQEQLRQQQEQQKQEQVRQQQEQQRQEQVRQQQEQQKQEQLRQRQVQKPKQPPQPLPSQQHPENQPRQPQPAQERQLPPGQPRQPLPVEPRQNPGQQPGQIHGTPKVLSTQESQQTIHELNQNRARMGGINRRPLPQGQVTSLPNGHHVIATNRGTHVEVRPNGGVERVTLRNGKAATYHANGQVGSIRAPGIQINHGLRGERVIVSERNGRRLVSEGPHRGYLEHPYLNRNGRAYVQRTYWEGGHPYARVYRDHYYHGMHYYRYVPTYYYHPVFYGWAYHPWATPIRYRWAWYGELWDTYYGAYFVPQPVYPSALWWLTDFLLAEDLRLAYEARQEAEARAAAYQSDEQVPPPPGEGPPAGQLSPEMKSAIAAEVQRQIAAEQAEATQPPATDVPPPDVGAENPPPALDPTHRLFVVSSNLDVSTADGQECELTGGDLITRIDDTPGDDGRVRVSVMTSKQQDCSVGSMPLVAVNDLQEMHNSFQEQIDSGLQKVASNQGRDGLPPAPDTQTAAGEVPPPVPDGDVDAQLASQQQEAEQTESEVQQEVQAEQSPPSQ